MWYYGICLGLHLRVVFIYVLVVVYSGYRNCHVLTSVTFVMMGDTVCFEYHLRVNGSSGVGTGRTRCIHVTMMGDTLCFGYHLRGECGAGGENSGSCSIDATLYYDSG